MAVDVVDVPRPELPDGGSAEGDAATNCSGAKQASGAFGQAFAG